MERSVIFKRERYNLTSKGYYISSNTELEEQLLHRAIWSDKNGPIPEGKVIHHIDENKANNDISNLLLMTVSEHSKVHSNLFTDWHRSEEGSIWHKANGIASWKKRITTDMECKHCKEDYKTYFPTRSKYCSKSCRAKAFRARRKA